MRFYLLIPITFIALSACTSSNTDIGFRAPSSSEVVDGLVWETKASNSKLWNQYCVGEADSSDVPQPNYSNKLVKNAVEVFKYVAPNSFYLYPAIVNAYGLKTATPPDGVSKQAHTFLTYLCGEFRDRASMVEAKLLWLARFNKLNKSKQKSIPATHENVWADLAGSSYVPFLSYSHDLWYARQAVAPKVNISPGSIQEGEESFTETAAVDGMTVCTVKYMVNEISKGKGFESLAKHDAGYAKYSKDCPKADLEDYYDFRGDSNFKPNSPESNGMIWYANHIASGCSSTKTARDPENPSGITNPGNRVTNETCDDYFRHPFRRRWQAARSGLATWLLHSEQHDDAFADDGGTPIVIWPHRITTKTETAKPFAFKVPKQDGSMTDPLEEWIPTYVKSDFAMEDFNFNKNILSLSESVAFVRLRDAMNRHTNWYQSQWDDGLGGKNSFKTQAYSPFVASSYEPSESDQFTFCGITVPCPTDGFKHWMFVFRVKGKNWFRVQDIPGAQRELNFSYQWFDETSLGTTALADAEHAWDRMGTALEEELEGGAILYLHNLTEGNWDSGGGQVSDDGNNR